MKNINRREFFSFITIAWVSLIASLGGIVSMLYRFSFPNLTFEPSLDFNAGKPTDFAPGVDERFKMTHGVWVVNSEGKLFALSNICTHLGCIPNWNPTNFTFDCPCHGSGYYISGINFKGPAPRPLERYKISLNDQGDVIISKANVYRYEKNQWDNPNSYIEIS